MNDNNLTSGEDNQTTTPSSNQSPQSNNVQNNASTPPVQSGGLQNYLTTSQTTQAGSRSVTGKLVATIFSLMILLGGLITGVFLVKQQQEIRSKASEQECIQSPNCIIIEDPQETGSYQINGIIYDVYLTDENANIFGAGATEDGCYNSSIEGNTVVWERVGGGDACNNLINIQLWIIEIPEEPTDPVISQCRNIYIYDEGWNLLNSDQLSQLSAGDIIKISANSTTTAGTINQARFTVNNEIQEPSSLKKPASNELFIDFVVPTNTSSLEIQVELYHSTFGWF